MNLEKIYGIITIILLVTSLILWYQFKDQRQEDSKRCALELNADFSLYNDRKYFKEDDKCCTYKLIDNSLKEVCYG